MAETISQVILERTDILVKALSFGTMDKMLIKMALESTFYDACRHERRQASSIATKKAEKASKQKSEGETGLAYQQGYRVACEDIAAGVLSTDRTIEKVLKEEL